MTGMIAQLLAWPALGVALLVFGFAPGVVLRLIVLFYRRGNPRRNELLSELYAVSRIERPFWVAEQLELALFEGVRDRFRAWRTGRRNRRSLSIDDLQAQLDELQREHERAIRAHNAASVRQTMQVQLQQADDPFARLLADDVARGWRGRGWRGAKPEKPKGDNGPPPAA